MKVTVIPIVKGAFVIEINGLVQELEDVKIRAETVQTTASLQSARILGGVPETCCHSNSSDKPSAHACEKNSHSINKDNNNIKEKARLSWTNF